MNTETVAALCKLNNDFYQTQCESFSQTRSFPWPGWQRCLSLFEESSAQGYLAGCRDFSMFDLACGNLRFESFVADQFPEAVISFYAVDNCDNLVPSQPLVSYQSFDVMDALVRGVDIGEVLAAPVCDVSVSFGFMHHVPLARNREKVLEALVRRTRSGGFVAVSFWQFLNNEALATRAAETHEQALNELGLSALDEGDFVLGWKKVPGAYRYCHNFSEEEIGRLADAVSESAEVVGRFMSDGRSGNLNSYLVLRVR